MDLELLNGIHDLRRIHHRAQHGRICRAVCVDKEDEMTLTERRAKFIYNAARIAAEASQAPIVPVPWDEREDAFKEQFLDVIEKQCGENRSHSPEELHGTWMEAYYAMGWVYGPKYSREDKVHPDLVPYAELGQLERDKDAVFVALCDLARQWIY